MVVRAGFRRSSPPPVTFSYHLPISRSPLITSGGQRAVHAPRIAGANAAHDGLARMVFTVCRVAASFMQRRKIA